MKFKYYALVGLAVVFLGTAVGQALAEEGDDPEGQLGNIQQEMQMQQQRAAQAQQQVESVSEQLRRIQGDLDQAGGEYKAIETKLAATEQQIKANEVILARVERDLADRSQVLNKRMRDIYKNGQINYLDVLFGANDFNDFATRLELLKRVMNQDIALVLQVKTERELVAQKKAELERDRAAITEMQKAAAEKQRLIQTRKSERQAVLDSAVNERDTAEKAYQELLETSRQIEEMIRSRQSGGYSGGPVAGGSGAMIWPASGPITSPFGWRTHPIFGTARYHSGIDIGADYGDPVAAADSGVVMYAGWESGYGKTVIIDHGNGISTLYGHNSELLVAEGQPVRRGQTIARVGATGYATGPHLHFEVRENGTPVSPLAYLP